MTNQQSPFVSVIVITFNRATILKACLESLNDQTYPKDRYEVIVVDDCSKDNTVEVARLYGAKVISHEVNRGIPSARNTGLAAAKGEITAYIDDDAIADPAWLENLIQPFSDPEVTASGGQTFAFKTEFIAERYLAAGGYGNPAPLAFGKSKNPISRFMVYLKSMFTPVTISAKPIEVQAVFGLNCAFRTSVLRAVGGYDETLLADEDSEISTRLRQSGAHIMFVPDAIIHHRHRERLGYLIRQTYRRSQYTVGYYAKEKKTLPIFPFPLLYITLLLSLTFFSLLTAIIFAVLGPLMLYCWWPIRAIRELHIEYSLYSYIQLALELAAILGMVKGKISIRKLKL